MTSMNQSQIRITGYYEFLQGCSACDAIAVTCVALKRDVVSRWAVTRSFQRFELEDMYFALTSISLWLASDWNNGALRNAHRDKPIATQGCRKLLSIWVLHELSTSKVATRVNMCQSLLLYLHRQDYLREVIAVDES
ncbi:hypothetical protein RB195_010145 [Necator americanus]|uniref:Mos1 transposase HTH domain-containing protein n=1 Tax=Necator americanus TaxID=51031 RepID=A0ABR1CWM4_NECAM